MILVTGATGYLGRHVTCLLDEGEVPYVASSQWGALGADLTTSSVVLWLLNRTKPSRIIHLAAVVPKNASGYSDGLAAAQSLAMVRNLAELATCPITFASSMTANYEAGGYARGKWLAEREIEARLNRSDRIIRLPGLFGAPRRSGVLYNAALAFLTEQPFELDAVPTTWAAMDVRDAAECMVAGEYTGSLLMDLPAAVSQVAHECGTAWGDVTGKFPQMPILRVRELVTWVRESVVKESTERTAASCRVSSQ